MASNENDTVELRLTKRQLFVAALALRYLQGNIDDANEALANDDDETIVVLNTVDNNLGGALVEEGEPEQLADLLIDAAK